MDIKISFRTTLKNEIPAWVTEGIVSEDGARRLSERYQLDTLDKESSGLLSGAIYALGGLLLGGGLISFVAANWDAIPTFAKVAVLMAALIGLHTSGWVLWHRKGWPTLGHALVFCGSLVFGANIGLMAQIFHISGDWYGLFAAWTIGAGVMAYAARSWITGLLALGTGTLWFLGYASDEWSWKLALVPIILTGVFGYLAFSLKSRALYVGAALELALTMAVLGGVHGRPSRVMVAVASAGFLAWMLGEFHRTQRIGEIFGNAIAGIGIVILGVCSYIWSFKEFWTIRSWWEPKPSIIWLIPVIVCLIAATAIVVMQIRVKNFRFLPLGTAVAIMGAAAIIPRAQGDSETLPVVLSNAGAFLIAGTAAVVGIRDERRIAFWAGTLYTMLLIVSRFLEYETSLLLKSAVFTGCGLAMIAAGVAYEKYLKREEAI